MANTVTTFAAGLGKLLSLLDEIFHESASAKAYINFLGWDLPPGVNDLGLAGIDLTLFLEKLRIVLESSEAESEDEILMAARIAELAVAMGKLVKEIQDLAEALPARLAGQGDYISRTQIHKELPRRMFDLLITGYLADRSPLSFSILNLLNIIEFKQFKAEEANFQVEHLRAIVHYDSLHSLFSDPAAHMRQAYGWGTPQFSVVTLLTRIGAVLRAMGAAIRLQPMDRRAEQALLGQTVPAAAEPSPQLIMPLYEELGVVAGAMFGLSAFGVRPSAEGAGDGGIGFLPILRGKAEGAIPLHAFEDTFLEFSAEADLLQRIALILRPNRPLQVQKASSLGQVAGGRIALGIRHGRPEAEPKPLLTFPGGSGLNIRQFALMGGLEKVSGSARESFLEWGLLGCQVVFSLSEADGFLSSTIPRDRIEALFDLRLGWSGSKGIYFEGSGGLQVTLPLHLSVGPLLLDSLHLAFDIREEGFDVEASTRGALTLGPVTVTVDRLGLLVNLSFGSGNLGLFGLSPRFKPPSGLGLSIEASVVVGGGYLFFDPQKEEYGGIVQLEIAETIAVKGIGLLTTRMPDGSKGFSLLVIVSAEGFAPIQLGFGFTLTGVGGLIGVNRTVKVDVLRGGIKTGTLGSILFPDDPIRNAPQIVSDLRSVFPPAKERYLLGPTALISWGTPTLLTLELALILELPDPVRLIILGRLRAAFPEEGRALVQVRMDAIGIIDFNKGEVSLDATLYDSRILQFVLTGDMALRANWGSKPNFVLAIGGLNPRFPPPAGFPKLNRLALNLSKGDDLQLRCECYLALTSNTVQFGARLDLHAAGGGFSFDGFLAFDALFQFSPFSFVVDLGAAVALRYKGHLLMGVSLKMTFSGPTPWHARGKATIKILFFKVSVSFDRKFGDDTPAPLPAPVDVLALLIEALADRRNWSSALPRGEHPLVTFREATKAGLQVHPLGELTVRERVVPLNLKVTQFGNAPLREGETTFTVTASGIGTTPLAIKATPVKDPFARAQFQKMTDDEKLASPSFEPQDAGLQFGLDEVAYQYEALLDSAIEYETLMIDPTRPPEKLPTPYRLSAAVLEAVAVLGAAGEAPIRRRGPARYRKLEPVT